jgi:hypothetical protein
MKKSIYQILKSFSDFASKHQQIASFETKPITENTAKGLKYPVMFIDIQGMTSSFQLGQISINCPVYFMDRIERDYSNLVNVISSELLKVDDLLTYFNDNECEFGFTVSYNGGVTPVVYSFEDLVSGQNVNLTINVGMSRNESQIPLD